MAIFPKVWELIETFKAQCSRKGWKVPENEDVVDVRGECHHLIWTQHIYPNTFGKVAKKSCVAIREGISYRMVNVSYTAWISPEAIAEKIPHVLLEDPDLSSKVAVYDVSPVYKGELVCLKMNRTGSIVFKEFEKFLAEEYSICFKPIHETFRSPRTVQQ